MTRSTSSVPPSRLARVRAANPDNGKRGPLLSPEAERFAQQVRADRPAADPKADWALPSILTGPRAIFWAIVVASFVIAEMRVGFLNSSQQAKRDSADIACIALTGVPGNAPVDRASRAFDMEGSRQNAARATAQCTPDDCGDGDLANYVRSLDDYLTSRRNILKYAYATSGANGVEHASSLQRSNADHDVVFGARRLMQAGVLDTKALTPANANLLRLIVRHANDGVPVCPVEVRR